MAHEKQDFRFTSNKEAAVAHQLKVMIIVFLCLFGPVLSAQASPAAQSHESAVSPSTGEDSTLRPIPVVLKPVTNRTFKGNLSAQGTLKAVITAVVSPHLPGSIKELYVEEGDAVVAHKTRLFSTDTLNLEKSVKSCRQAFELASRELAAKIENFKLLEQDKERVFGDFQQFRKLIAKGLISNEEFKRAESRYQRARSDCRIANSLATLAWERKKLKESELELTEKEFSNATVYAPISGRVTRRFRGPGEMCDSGQPVLSIEDPSIIDVAACLPTRYYALIHPGKTRLNLETCGIKLWDQVISFKSFSIDPGKCTFTVKSRLKELTEEILSGALAEVTIPLPPCKGLGVPSSCIQRRGKESFVFVLRGKTAHRVLVQTGIECDGWTHLTAGNLHENDLVVPEGCLRLQEGTPVVTKKKGH